MQSGQALALIFVVLQVINTQKLYEDTVQNFTFSTRLNEKLAVKYYPEDELLDVQIKAIYPDKSGSLVSENERFWKIKQSEQFCKPIQRGVKETIIYTQQLDQKLFNNIKSIIEYKNTIHLLTNNLEIFNYHVNKQGEQIHFTELQTNDQISTVEHLCDNCEGFLVDKNQSMLYVVTKNKIYSKHDHILIDQSKLNLIVRQQTYKSFIYNNILYMSQGKDGIDIYAHKVFFEFNMNMNQTHMEVDQPIDIRDLYMTNDNVLYVLCYNTGLHLFKMDNEGVLELESNKTVKIIQKLITIPDAKHGTKLRIKESQKLVFVIGEDLESKSFYLKELVLFEDITNFNTNYKVNRYYNNSLQYFDVQFAKNYVLIVGSFIHQVLFHMTSSDIVKDEENVSGYMVKNNVKYIRLIQNIMSDNYNMLMLTDTQIKYYKIDEISAGIECLADSSITPEQYEYQIDIITRNCASKALANDQSPLSACHMQHYLNVNLYKGFSYDDKIWVTVLILVISSSLILLFGFFYLRYRRWSQSRMSSLQLEVDQYKNIAYTKMNQQEQTISNENQSFTIDIESKQENQVEMSTIPKL